MNIHPLRKTVVVLSILLYALCVHAQQSGLRFEFGRTGEEVNSASEGRDAMNDAQDIFVVTVGQVSTTPEDMGNGTIVKVKAKIDGIIRSTKQRDIGDEIVIRYRTALGTPYEKSTDPMIPQQGSKLKVYLKYTGAGRYYRLAAAGYSFVRMNTGTNEYMPDTESGVTDTTDIEPYTDPYRKKTQPKVDTLERERLEGLRQGDNMPHAIDPYEAKPSNQTHEKNMDPYEPIGL